MKIKLLNQRYKQFYQGPGLGGGPRYWSGNYMYIE